MSETPSAQPQVFADTISGTPTNAALRESDDTYRYFFDHSAIGMSITIVTGEVHVNDAFAMMLGYSRDELEERPWQEITHPDDVELTTREIAALIAAEKESVRFDKRFVRKDGSIVWVDLVSTLRRGKDGVPVYFVTSLADITQRKQAEKALAHSHDLMRYVIENSNSAVAVHDRDLRYVYVSERYLTEYGVREHDVIGKHHYEVFPDLPQKWKDVHQRALAGEVLSADEDPYPREDGTTDWTRWECRPWFEDDGSIGGIIVYTEVITERKQAEQALCESEARLSRVIDGTDVGTWEWDVQTGETVFNERWAQIVGYSLAELAPVSIQTWLDLVSRN